MFKAEPDEVECAGNHEELIEDAVAELVVPPVFGEVEGMEHQVVGIEAVMEGVERLKACQCANPGFFIPEVTKFFPHLFLEIFRQHNAAAIAG